MAINHKNKVIYACNTHVLHGKIQCLLRELIFYLLYNSKII
jgi:hypothetical protein